MGDNRNPGCLDLLRASAGSDNEARASATTVFTWICAGAIFCDCLCATIFALLGSNWNTSSAWSSLQGADLSDFKGQAWDCVLLAFLRAVLLPSLVALTVKAGNYAPDTDFSAVLARPSTAKETPGDGLSLYEPLVDAVPGGGMPGEEIPCGHSGGDGHHCDRHHEAKEHASNLKAQEAAEEEHEKQLAFASKLKHTGMATLFLLSTAFQLYVGLKVSAYESFGDGAKHSYSVQVALLCSSVFWVNLEVYALRSLIGELTRQSGLFLPVVHPHPLFKHKGVALHWCDVCSTKIKGTEAWRCKLCDFDMCPTCATRKDVGTVAENLLRGDKGKRTEASLSSTTYLRRALGLASENGQGLLYGAFVLLFCYTATNLLLPDYQGKIIDRVASGQKAGFYRAVKTYLGIMLLQGLFSAGFNASFSMVSRRVLFFVRTALFENVVAQDVAFFDGTTSGHLTSRLNNDVNTMMEPIRSSLSTLLYNGVTLVGSVGMCYYTSYELSMLAFVTVGPIMYLWDLYGNWSKVLTRRMLSAWAEGNSVATEVLGHIRTVKAFASEPLEKRLYRDANGEALRLGIKDSIGFGLTSALTGYLDLGAGVLILWYGGKLVLDGDESGDKQVMTIGKLVTFQLYWNMMNNSYQALQGLITSFTRSAAAAEKVFGLIDSVADIGGKGGEGNTGGDDDDSGGILAGTFDDAEDEGVGSVSNPLAEKDAEAAAGAQPPSRRGPAPVPIAWSPFRGEFALKDVDYFYQMRPDKLVLQGLSLVVPGGSVCALVGRSGGGKSTVISMLMRFYDPRSGSISLDGRDLRTLRVPDLRRCMGVVAQDTPLFARSVLGNITYGLEDHEYTMEQVVSAATKAQAHEFISEMKDGYHTRVGERGGRLSGGQRQRIAIARVFLRKPKICLLDEATSALDEDSQSAVQASLDALIAEGGATVVLVAHRLSTVMNADKIAVIDGGRVVEEGSHACLVAKEDGVYAALVRKQTAKKAALINADDEGGDGGEGAAAAGGGVGRGASQSAEGGQGKEGAGAADSVDKLMDDIKLEQEKKARQRKQEAGLVKKTGDEIG